METQGLTQVEIMILYSACLRPRFGAHMLGPVVHSGPKMEPNNGRNLAGFDIGDPLFNL